MDLLKKPSIHIIPIILLGILAYSNTFHVPFFLDDIPNIVENNKLLYLSNFWPPTGSRWFGFLTFALNYHIGGLNVIGYHIVNLTIHTINALLVYRLVVLTFRTSYFKVSVFSAGVSKTVSVTSVSDSKKELTLKTDTDTVHYSLIALFSGLLFVVHPIQTQAVTYIVQRVTSLATMFYLLSLVMYINFRLWVIGNRSAVKSPTHHLLPITYYLLSILSAILAMKTKEISFTLPVIVALYEFMFFEGKIKRRLLYLIPLLLTMWIIPLSFVEIDRPAGDVIGDLRETTQETETISRWSYLFTQFRVVVTYIRLLFLPINQHFDYGYPIYTSFFNPNVYLSFLFLLGIFVFAVYLFYASRVTHRSIFDITPPLPPLKFPHSGGFAEEKRGGRVGLKGGMGGFDAHSPIHPRPSQRGGVHQFTYFRLIAFGVFWFFITLSVESSIIPIRTVIFEHRVYLPSVGAIIAVTSAIFYALQIVPHSSQSQNLELQTPSRLFLYTVYCILSTAVIVLSIATYQRNIVWKEGVNLWDAKKWRTFYKSGLYFLNTQHYDKAIENFLNAINRKPRSLPFDLELTLYLDLAKAYQLAGNLEKEIETYQKTLVIGMNDVSPTANIRNAYFYIHTQLGTAFFVTGRLSDAKKEFEKVLAFDPENIVAHYRMGLIYRAYKDYNASINHLKKAVSVASREHIYHSQLGEVYLLAGQIENATEEFSICLRLNPDDVVTRELLQQAKQKLRTKR